MAAEVLSRSLLSAILRPGWMRCFCLFAAFWVWVFWASAPVIEVGVVQTLRQLRTLGVLSFISLSSSWRSFLGCLRGVGPLRNLVCNPDHILSHHVPGLLHPGCEHLHPSFLHSKAGIRATARWHTQHLRMQKGGTGAWARLGLVFGSPLRSLILFPTLARLVILLVAQFCWWSVCVEDPCVVGSVCL